MLKLVTENIRNDIIDLFTDCLDDPKYDHFINLIGTNFSFVGERWPDLTIASVDYAIIDNNDIVGYIRYRIDIESDTVNSFILISFKPSITVIHDSIKLLNKLISSHRYVTWDVIKGTKIEKYYNKLMEKNINNTLISINIEDNSLVSRVIYNNKSYSIRSYSITNKFINKKFNEISEYISQNNIKMNI